jgi:hypothetical protein
MNLLENTQAVSILKDPFASSNIEAVMLRAWRKYDGAFDFYSKVEFKNGNTKGEQQIDAASFEELLTKTKAFLETLKK